MSTTAAPAHRRRSRRRIIGAVLVAALLVGTAAALWQRANPTVLEDTVVIDAPAAVVWAVLTDIEAYPEWNPFLIGMRGELVEGGRLELRTGPEPDALTITPEVLDVSPERALRWEGYLWVTGIFDGRHEFLVQPLGPDRVRFVQREEFRGVTVPFAASWLRRDTLPRFEAMNAALRERAESLAER